MSLSSDWNSGGANANPSGSKPNLRDILNTSHGLSSLAALKAIPAAERSDGMPARVTSGSAAGAWRWNAASTLAGDDILVVNPTDAPTAGRWIREVQSYVDMQLPIAFGTLDAAVLYTVPTGFELEIESSFFEVTADFTGGASSAIGLSSNNASLATKGDVLGGASGDVAATLVAAGVKAKGTKGAKMGNPGAYLVGGNTIRFDRITSAFTAGTGVAHVHVTVVVAP